MLSFLLVWLLRKWEFDLPHLGIALAFIGSALASQAPGFAAPANVPSNSQAWDGSFYRSKLLSRSSLSSSSTRLQWQARAGAYLVCQAEADLYKGLSSGGQLREASDAPAIPAGSFGSGAATLTLKLTGGVSHAEKLEPLPASECTGALVLPSIQTPTRGSTFKALPAIKAPASVPSFKSPARVDASLQNLEQARQSAALKSQAAKVDPALAAYKKRMQAVIEQNLQAGAAKVQNKRTLKGGHLKVRIPHWLAGHWLRQESEEVSRVDLATGVVLKPLGRQPARVVDVFGTVKDKNGVVWMVVPLSATGSVDRGFAMDYHRVRRYQIIETGKNSCLVKVQASHYVVDKGSHRVLQAYQDEELNAYKLVRPGLVSTVSSVKVFDEKGDARLLTRAVSSQKRVRLI